MDRKKAFPSFTWESKSVQDSINNTRLIIPLLLIPFLFCFLSDRDIKYLNWNQADGDDREEGRGRPGARDDRQEEKDRFAKRIKF